MIVVRHQNVAVDSKPRPLTRFPQCSQESSAVFVRLAQWALPVTPRATTLVSPKLSAKVDDTWPREFYSYLSGNQRLVLRFADHVNIS
jgi:hypothetical protein